ncbi:unnamed protein product [Oikopleura dioica]|uniref:Uncharacterized protein n=1 Tax=Oikopleura dioica TaxID=34765 RepID=E4YRP9_OIKDI|nr:unnamed protein product [Oikopleura dioica]
MDLSGWSKIINVIPTGFDRGLSNSHAPQVPSADLLAAAREYLVLHRGYFFSEHDVLQWAGVYHDHPAPASKECLTAFLRARQLGCSNWKIIMAHRFLPEQCRDNSALSEDSPDLDRGSFCRPTWVREGAIPNENSPQTTANLWAVTDERLLNSLGKLFAPRKMAAFDLGELLVRMGDDFLKDRLAAAVTPFIMRSEKSLVEAPLLLNGLVAAFRACGALGTSDEHFPSASTRAGQLYMRSWPINSAVMECNYGPSREEALWLEADLKALISSFPLDNLTKLDLDGFVMGSPLTLTRSDPIIDGSDALKFDPVKDCSLDIKLIAESIKWPKLTVDKAADVIADCMGIATVELLHRIAIHMFGEGDCFACCKPPTPLLRIIGINEILPQEFSFNGATPKYSLIRMWAKLLIFEFADSSSRRTILRAPEMRFCPSFTWCRLRLIRLAAGMTIAQRDSKDKERWAEYNAEYASFESTGSSANSTLVTSVESSPHEAMVLGSASSSAVGPAASSTTLPDRKRRSPCSPFPIPSRAKRHLARSLFEADDDANPELDDDITIDPYIAIRTNPEDFGIGGRGFKAGHSSTSAESTIFQTQEAPPATVTESLNEVAVELDTRECHRSELPAPPASPSPDVHESPKKDETEFLGQLETCFDLNGSTTALSEIGSGASLNTDDFNEALSGQTGVVSDSLAALDIDEATPSGDT